MTVGVFGRVALPITYDIDVSPTVMVGVSTLEGNPVGFGLVFLERQRLDSDDLQLIFSFLSSVYPGIKVDSTIRNFIAKNAEIDVFQICRAESIPFGSMWIWAGKIHEQTVSIRKHCLE